MTITQIIRNISGMLLLMSFYDKSNMVLGVVTLDQLKTVCMYGFPNGFTYDNMPPKEVCSAMGMYNFYPPPQGIDLSNLKQGLPYVYVLQARCTSITGEDNEVIELDKSQFNAEVLKRTINEFKVDALVFSFFERQPLPVEIPFTIDSYIISVYKEIKAFKKDLLIGLILPSSSPNELMIRLKDSLGDLNSFYVIETSNSLFCEYHKNQTEMLSPLTAADLKKTMRYYNDLGYPAFQTFFTIDVVVKLLKKLHYVENLSYSQMCDVEFDPHNRYCKQTLAELHSQIEAIRFRGRFPSLGGVFVLYADFDDSKDTCHCGQFPALRVIDGAIKLLPKNDILVGCKTFGQNS